MVRQTSQEVERTACLWAARLDDGPLSETDQAELDAWLAGGDERRLGAFARARAVALHSRRAAALAGGAVPLPPRPARPMIHRRGLIAASVGALAVGGAGAYAFFAGRGYAFETRMGETRVVPLDDGSVMTVNTLSEGDVRYGRRAREVVLETGEALFNVVAETGRPFIVRAGEAAVIANGASFLVRRLERAPLQVVSFSGHVELNGPTGEGLILAPNTRAALAEGERPVRVGAVDADRELAWRHGRIQLEDETLARAAREFARYNPTRITPADPAVAALRITGLFVANDPVSFAHAAAGSLDLKVDVNAREIRLSRRSV
ncbi:FecR family protein [Brevundimonas faecalis]|uniref:Transmembrane sensor n=1 Tax=Brevundimonas faecalis TaxID=947378 RepID=A0ABV2R7Z1_9CAUL